MTVFSLVLSNQCNFQSSLFISWHVTLYFIATTSDEEFVRQFQYRRLRKGDGKNYPQKEDQVTINYIGIFPETQEQFDSSYDRGQTLDFIIGVGQVIPCLDEMISRMSLGERGVIICPAHLGYGKEGVKGKIPPNSDLEFEVEVLRFRGLQHNAMELWVVSKRKNCIV